MSNFYSKSSKNASHIPIGDERDNSHEDFVTKAISHRCRVSTHYAKVIAELQGYNA